MGVASAFTPWWSSTLDVFALELKSELVFSGDAGVTEPNGASTRTGVEWGNSLRVTEWLSADFNATFALARFDATAAPDDLGCGGAAASHACAAVATIRGRYVPNSPTNVVDAGLMARRLGWFGAVRARHSGRWTAVVDVFNLADVRWNDVEY